MKYKKWRDLSVDFSNIPFENFKLLKIVSYPPAGNDVVECVINGNRDVFIKFERSKVAFFKNECNNIKKIGAILKEVPTIIEYGSYNNKDYIVLTKKSGSRLSDIFKRSIKYKKEYLYKYGEYLSKIHNIDGTDYNKAIQRQINCIPSNYSTYDDYSNKIIEWLKDNEIKICYDTFIHGDYHYGNVLFKNKKVNGVLDWEYSGLGFKEQDIAWACILRPGQKFMDNIDDVMAFVDGYKSNGIFDIKNFVWCYINGSIHFYLMNMNDDVYKNKIMRLIECIKEVYGVG